MVAGIDSFRDKFRGFEDCYTVIGGAACDILAVTVVEDICDTLTEKISDL